MKGDKLAYRKLSMSRVPTIQTTVRVASPSIKAIEKTNPDKTEWELKNAFRL